MVWNATPQDGAGRADYCLVTSVCVGSGRKRAVIDEARWKDSPAPPGNVKYMFAAVAQSYCGIGMGTLSNCSRKYERMRTYAIERKLHRARA